MTNHRTFWKKPKPKRIGVQSEAALQTFTDEYLDVRHISYFRIPDSFWSFLHATAHPGIKAMFRKFFGGVCDNTCFIPISDKYSLCLHLELKSRKGSLHGKQKVIAKELPWQIARDHETVMSIVSTFEKDATRMKEVCSRLEEESQQEQQPPPSTD